MKHLAVIQSEFLKEAREWEDMSYEDQKGYLSRHPNTKRKITARPESGQKVDDDEKSTSKKTEAGDTGDFYTNLVEKLTDKPKSWINDRIQQLQEKMDHRMETARRREQRAHGDLDGTAFEAAYEHNQPLEIEQKLLKHYLENGDKKLSPELQQEVASLEEHKKYRSERKEKQSQEKEKHADLVGKNITWTSKKNFGQKMTGRVIKIKVGRHGSAMAVTDTGWRVPVDLIDKTTKPDKSEANKEAVSPKELVGKMIRWKTKKRPGMVTKRRHGMTFRYEQSIPNYDPATGTAGSIVTGAGSSKVKTKDGWTIPLSLILEADGKKFKRWQ
ncbi:MAG: hypothetical protein Q7R33_09565 [Nitrosarchaeum sp.]|nr:hypothetical protein [Nitrosarchaeum sp.]